MPTLHRAGYIRLVPRNTQHVFCCVLASILRSWEFWGFIYSYSSGLFRRHGHSQVIAPLMTHDHEQYGQIWPLPKSNEIQNENMHDSCDTLYLRIFIIISYRHLYHSLSQIKLLFGQLMYQMSNVERTFTGFCLHVTTIACYGGSALSLHPLSQTGALWKQATVSGTHVVFIRSTLSAG